MKIHEFNLGISPEEMHNYMTCVIKSDDNTVIIEMMHKSGKCFARLSVMLDEIDTICIDFIGVDDSRRNLGYGREMIELASCIGLANGAVKARIICLKDSWLHKWYERLGFVDLQEHETEKDWVWMVRNITSGEEVK